MISEIIFIATAGIIDPMDMSGNYMYPSGVKECDKYPMYAPPQSKLAKLALPQDILADDGRVIQAGHYLVGLSVSKNTLLFFEGTKAVFEAKITETEILEMPAKLSTAEFNRTNDGQSQITFVQGKFKAKANVTLANKKHDYID